MTDQATGSYRSSLKHFTAEMDAEPPRVVIHLTSSRFFGGPERQMLELARETANTWKTIFASFSEGGLCRSFLDEVQEAGFDAIELSAGTPRLLRATRQLTQLLPHYHDRVPLQTPKVLLMAEFVEPGVKEGL